MTVEVDFDRHVISQTSLPVCKSARSNVNAAGEQGTISFSFVAGRPIVWRGYRSDHDTTRARQRITGDIWEAGADPDALILGAAFGVRGRITMNTIHIAHPGKADTTQVARGLVVLTYLGPARPWPRSAGGCPMSGGGCVKSWRARSPARGDGLADDYRVGDVGCGPDALSAKQYDRLSAHDASEMEQLRGYVREEAGHRVLPNKLERRTAECGRTHVGGPDTPHFDDQFLADANGE